MSPHTPLHVVADGPRAVEAAWLAALAEEHLRVRGSWELVARPLLVVVPSSHLREHVLSRAAHALGALAGFEVATLDGVAHAVLERSNEPPPRGSKLFRPLVREALEHVEGLARPLGAFERGAEPLEATLRDLFDAGFRSELASPLREADLDHARRAEAPHAQSSRTAAIVDAAELVARRGTALRAEPASERFVAAARALRRRPEMAHAREVWILGFADATGAQLELLAALAAAGPSRVFSDASANAHDGYGARLRETLGVPRAPAEAAPRAEVDRMAADDRGAQVEALAARVRAEIDGGVAPERIGVVARDLARLLPLVRVRFARLGIPFATARARTEADGATRRARALARTLADGPRTALDTWFTARAHDDEAEIADVRAALASLGARTLDDLARLDLAPRRELARGVPLPVRLAIEDDAADDDANAQASEPGERVRAERRRVPLATMRAHAENAARALERLAAAPPVGPLSTHAETIARFVGLDLGWRDDADLARAWSDAHAALALDLPRGLELPRATFLALAAEELETARDERALGRGGVRVLSAADARGLTFDVLFLAGLERDHFPRNVREDPLLEDSVRAAWRAVLPDLPLKTLGHDEERRLFDQLVRSAPRVCVSWSRSEADGRELFESPLLARLRDAREAVVPPLGARPAHERAIEVALAGGVDALEQVLPIVLREADEVNDLGLRSHEAVASARAWALAELEPRGARRDLGAFLGQVGETARASDPRSAALPVTTLEAVAGCGWRAFLGRMLKLEPAADPWAEIASWDPLVLGNAVHAVLERVTLACAPRDAAPARDLASALASPAWKLAWPDERTLAAWTLEASRIALADAGVLFPGLETLLARRVLACVGAQRELDAREPELEVFGAEVEGAVAAPDGPAGARALTFRADRAERSAGAVRLTDFKTGRPLSTGAKEETRAKAVLAALRRGERLQGAAYALAVQGVGRYVSLRPDVDAAHRVNAIDASDPEARAAFAHATGVVWSAIDRGAFVPRLLDARARAANPDCERCDLALACVQGDSGARDRLRRFQVLATSALDATHTAARDLLLLASVNDEPSSTERGAP